VPAVPGPTFPWIPSTTRCLDGSTPLASRPGLRLGSLPPLLFPSILSVAFWLCIPAEMATDRCWTLLVLCILRLERFLVGMVDGLGVERGLRRLQVSVSKWAFPFSDLLISASVIADAAWLFVASLHFSCPSPSWFLLICLPASSGNLSYTLWFTLASAYGTLSRPFSLLYMVCFPVRSAACHLCDNTYWSSSSHCPWGFWCKAGRTTGVQARRGQPSYSTRKLQFGFVQTP